jgi:hypothetical protein
MGKRKFYMTVTCELTLELDDQVIDVVDDQWRHDLYDLRTPEEIAEMIGDNMIRNRASLSDLDGWADQPDSNAKILDEEWYIDDVEEIGKK